MNRSCSQCSNLGLGILQSRGGGGEASVKIGGLWKRSQGVSRFTKPNYKHRVFILTDQALSYYQGTIDRIGQLKGRVSLDTVRAVEFVQDSAFNLAHTFQIVYQSKKHGFVTLYVTATDNNHCSEWVASLRQACYFNRDMLMHFHPGAMKKNKWTCCSQRGKTTLGCQPTYHLLTRSSSRYAQMRRRDTLTSIGSQRRLRNSCGPYASLDRQSLTTCSHVSDREGSVGVQGKPGQGLSNSCMNLTSVAPHRVESFILDNAPTSSSQRSSRVSTDHSVGVDSITLTRVSLVETTQTGFDSEVEGQDMRLDGSQQSLPPLRQNSSKRHSRSQVAPELETSLPVKHFPLSRTHPLEMEHKSLTLPNPKSKSRKRYQRYVDSVQLAGEEGDSPRPVPPPRHRKHHLMSPDSSLTASVHCIPIDRAGKDSPLPHDNEPHDDNVESGKLKHSQTFVVQCQTQTVRGAIEQQHLKPPSKDCSQSMNALSKPMIAPKFSLTNPNIVHV